MHIFCRSHVNSVTFDSTMNSVNVNFLAGLINNLTLTGLCAWNVVHFKFARWLGEPRHAIESTSELTLRLVKRFHHANLLHSPATAVRCARKAWAQLITPAQRAPRSRLVYHVEWITVRPFPRDAHFSPRHRRRHLRVWLRLGSVRPGWCFTRSLSNSSSGFNSRVGAKTTR